MFFAPRAEKSSARRSVLCFIAGFYGVYFVPSHPFAATTAEFNCQDLRKAAQKVEVYSGNIANQETTRTPEGGPYKRVELKCRDLYCETIRQESFRVIYDPKHPDANQDGYVSYPAIQVPSEFAALNTAAAEVRLLASKDVCGAKAILSNNAALVKYDPGSSIQSDTFNFSVDGRLTSWSRVLRDGSAKHFSFNLDGTATKMK